MAFQRRVKREHAIRGYHSTAPRLGIKIYHFRVEKFLQPSEVVGFRKI